MRGYILKINEFRNANASYIQSQALLNQCFAPNRGCQCLRFFVCLFVFKVFIYFERDRDSMSGGGAERERERERESQAGSMLPVQSLMQGFSS